MLHIVVLAKLPRPGLAKTRLIPALGAEGAARLAERLLREAVAAAAAVPGAQLELCLTPHTDDPLAAELAQRHGCRLARQVDGDLGARMADAASRLLRGGGSAVLLMGSDAPALDTARLAEAASLLHTHDAVLVPAADGGYAALGLTRWEPTLFTAMPWSTAAVLATTRERLAAAQMRWAECRTVHDIDEPADLVHLPMSWRPSSSDLWP